LSNKIKNGNGHGCCPIERQPLSELQKSILLTAHENKCRATLSQVRTAYYGRELSPQAAASAQACISRARRGLIKRGLIEEGRAFFVLTLAGWDIADALVLAREKVPEVIANEEDLARHQRIAAAHRGYDEFLFSMGRRRPTAQMILDGAPLPPRVRPRIQTLLNGGTPK
jgi:hypothetical protein